MQNVFKNIYSLNSNMIKTSITPLVRHHPAGTIISIDCGFYRHVGMLGDYALNGQRLVLAFSLKARGFIEHTIDDFTNGGDFRIDGYLGKLAPSEVLMRAQDWRALPYSLLERNCEHFVYYAHGLAPQSPQLVMAGISAALWLIFRPERVV